MGTSRASCDNARAPVFCVFVYDFVDGAIPWSWNRTPGIQSAVWLYGPLIVRPRDVHRDWGVCNFVSDVTFRNHAYRNYFVRGDLVCGYRSNSSRRAFRALYANFLRNVDARIRHAVSLNPVQVLRFNRRRSGHASGSAVAFRHGVVRRKDVISDRSVLLLLHWIVRHSRRCHVANCAIGVRPKPDGDLRERR